MPYYVYKITQPTPVLKNLELLDSFVAYKEARALARENRAQLPIDSGITIKLMFAASELEAEEELQKKREETVVMEWEK